MSPSLLHALLIAAAWAVLALLTQVAQLRSFGRKVYFSTPAAKPRRGVVYAFTAGMLPTAKESVRTHLSLYLVGIGFHLGLASGLLRLGFDLTGVDPGAPGSALLASISLLGGVAGLILLIRRAATGWLRALSTPDDYVSNLLCTGLLLLIGARILAAELTTASYLAAALLLVYVPLGKIRHCVFFFPARYHSAYFFGRRGAYPPRA